MPSQLEYVEAQVMQLTPVERNHLLERIFLSLDARDDFEVCSDNPVHELFAPREKGSDLGGCFFAAFGCFDPGREFRNFSIKEIDCA